MVDSLGRSITYLRISVTDRCNLRCRYCMPEEGVCIKKHSDMMTEEELVTAEEAAVYANMMTMAKVRQQVDAAMEPKEEQPEEEQQAVEDTAYFQMRQRITELLSTLSEADAKLLTLRFGLEGGLPLSPEEAGKKLGLPSQEVVMREANALAKLRAEK